MPGNSVRLSFLHKVGGGVFLTKRRPGFGGKYGCLPFKTSLFDSDRYFNKVPVLKLLVPKTKRTKQQRRAILARAPRKGAGRPRAAPVALAYTQRTSRARITPAGDAMRVRHTELIDGAISGSSAFAVLRSIALNPGVPESFPWLSQQANLYSQYEFLGLTYTYKPTIGTGQAGAFMLAFNYDAGDLPPASEIAMMDFDDAKQGVSWSPISLSGSAASMREGARSARKFTRRTPIPPGVSPQLYDAGNFYFASNNFPAPTISGKLTVTYDVLLYKPQLEPTTYPFQSGNSTTWEGGTSVSSGDGSSLFKDYGTLQPSNDSLGAGPMVDGRITLPADGYYAFSGDVPMGDEGKLAGGANAYMQSYVKEVATGKRVGYSRDDNSATSYTTVNHNFAFYAKKGVQLFARLTGTGAVPPGWLGGATIALRLISTLAGVPLPILAALDADPAGVIRWDGSASYEPPDV